jgi:hypothetical protein
MRTSKDWEILIIAITKSVIESGAPVDDWETRVYRGLSIVLNAHNRAMGSDTPKTPKETVNAKPD